MSYTRYKKYMIVDSDDNNTLKPLMTQDGLYIVSTEEVAGYVPIEEIEQAIRSPINKRFVQVFLLREDETVVKDITPWVQLSGNIEKKDTSGQSRSASLSLVNEKINGEYLWIPKPNQGGLWNYNKIKIVSGIYLYDRIYEVREGVFVLHNPSLEVNAAQHKVTMQCYDKFALLDGTIDGIGDIDYEVARRTPLRDAVTTMLKLERTTGIPFDLKDPIFPTKYSKELSPYTLKKTGENSIGAIMKDLTTMVSCDIKYDDDGRMNVVDTLTDLDAHHRSVVWNFREGEFMNPKLQIKRSQIKNKITVIGANINGSLVKATVENTNPMSNYNVNSDFGVKAKKITDDLLYSNYLCEERARYEMKKTMQNYATINLQCIYIPHLEPGDIVRWTYEPWGIEQEEFIVNTVSVPINPKENMSISLTNLAELPL